MSEDKMETRVSILEDRVSGLVEMKKKVDETHEKVFELGVMLKSHVNYPICPAPGKCLELDVRMQKIETSMAESRGGWKIIAAVSAAATAIAVWLANHFSTRHTP